MQSLSDRFGSDCSSNVEGSDFDSDPTVGWNTVNIFLDRFIENKGFERKLINLAKKKIPLSSIIFKYKIKFIEKQSFSGWTHTANCPFPDHKDSTPSFGFNSKDNFFKCFGCDRGGGSVEFLSALLSKTLLEVAKELLSSVNDSEIIEELDEDLDKIDSLLLNFSIIINNYLIKYSQNLDIINYIEKLLWSVDCYVAKRALDGTMELLELEELINKITSYLDKIEIVNE